MVYTILLVEIHFETLPKGKQNKPSQLEYVYFEFNT